MGWNARRLTLGSWLAGLSLVVATSLSLVRCGGTGTDLEGFPEGDQFVNEGCNNDSVCLRFTISPSRIPADGVSTAHFIATLLNTDGSPAAGEEVCFFVEDPLAATIIEPVGDNCELTGSDGRVSGRVQAGTQPVSVRILAQSFSRSLETSVILLLGQASPPDPVAAGLSLSPASATITTGQSVTLTARLRDSNNQPIAGATIVFSRTPATGSLSASSAITDASGQASVSFTGGTPGTVTVTAQSGTLAANSQITVNAPATPTPVPTPPGCVLPGGNCTSTADCCQLPPPQAASVCVNHGPTATCDQL